MPLFSATALGPNDPAFRGRASERERLIRLCREDVRSYGVLYGGRQNGKTSLLFQLEAAFAFPTRVCRVDFQQIQGANAARAFGHIASKIRTVLPGGDAQPIGDGAALQSYLQQALAPTKIPRLVLLLDELGALPAATREELGNALRAIFTDRLVVAPLTKLQIIFSGGVELYDMVVSEVSSLHSVCEEIYLPDLAEREAVALMSDGLQQAGLAAALSVALGQAVYAQVAGHPYLTQRIGELLVGYHTRGEALTIGTVGQATQELQASAPPLLRRIRADLRDHQLEEAAKRLLSNPPRFTRLDDQMARLELIGLAKPAGANWAPRNRLLAGVFGELLDVAIPPPQQPDLTTVPESPEPEPKRGSPSGVRPAEPQAPQPNLTALRQLLVTHFNDNELRDLCFDLGIDYESLPGEGKSGKARELVAYVVRHARLPELFALGQAVRPQADWVGAGGVAPAEPASEPPRTRWERVAPSADIKTPPIAPDIETQKRRATEAFSNVPSEQAKSLIASYLSEATLSQEMPARRTAKRITIRVPELVRVPAGSFLMGSSDVDNQAESKEKPQHTLELPDYWIGKTPVTHAQFRLFVESDGYANQSYWTTAGWEWCQPGNITKPAYWDNAKRNGADFPVVGVSWFESMAYCRWLSAQTGVEYRLPSEAEWEKAARGPDGRIWPWGHTWEDGRCNSATSALSSISRSFGRGKTTPVGQYLSGASPYGVLDMAGNVREWCSTKVPKPYPYVIEDEWEAHYLDGDANRYSRGGDYSDGPDWVRGARRTSINLPRDRFKTCGLRVASHFPGE